MKKQCDMSFLDEHGECVEKICIGKWPIAKLSKDGVPLLPDCNDQEWTIHMELNEVKTTSLPLSYYVQSLLDKHGERNLCEALSSVLKKSVFFYTEEELIEKMKLFHTKPIQDAAELEKVLRAAISRLGVKEVVTAAERVAAEAQGKIAPYLKELQGCKRQPWWSQELNDLLHSCVPRISVEQEWTLFWSRIADMVKRFGVAYVHVIHDPFGNGKPLSMEVLDGSIVLAVANGELRLAEATNNPTYCKSIEMEDIIVVQPPLPSVMEKIPFEWWTQEFEDLQKQLPNGPKGGSWAALWSQFDKNYNDHGIAYLHLFRNSLGTVYNAYVIPTLMVIEARNDPQKEQKITLRDPVANYLFTVPLGDLIIAKKDPLGVVVVYPQLSACSTGGTPLPADDPIHYVKWDGTVSCRAEASLSIKTTPDLAFATCQACLNMCWRAYEEYKDSPFGMQDKASDLHTSGGEDSPAQVDTESKESWRDRPSLL